MGVGGGGGVRDGGEWGGGKGLREGGEWRGDCTLRFLWRDFYSRARISNLLVYNFRAR